MNRETFNYTYENELTPKQKKVLPLFLDGRSDDDIIRELNATEQFLQSFYHYIIQELPSVPPLKEWDRNTSAIINCTKDFQNLLKHLGKVLVLVLDEVDQRF